MGQMSTRTATGASNPTSITAMTAVAPEAAVAERRRLAISAGPILQRGVAKRSSVTGRG
jgi:hypothetical protein